MKLICSFFVLLLTLALAYGETSDETMAELRKIDNQFVDVHNQIQKVQMEASETPSVKKAREGFEAAMQQAMLEADPEAKDDIKRSNELLEQIRTHPDNNDPRARAENMELIKLYLDYQILERKLGPAREQAAKADAPLEQFKKLETVTLAEMKKINPYIEKLMERKEELVTEFRALRNQAE